MMALRIISSFLVSLILVLTSFSQENEGVVLGTFRDTRIINGQSIKTNPKGTMKFIISHRFGSVAGGIQTLYGLDDATMRIGLDYGISDHFTVGLGRSSNEQTVDGFLKYRLLYQGKKSPVSVTSFLGNAIKTQAFAPRQEELLEFKHRLFYTYQVLIARKFSDIFSLQLMPSIVHRNLIQTEDDSHTIFAIGFAGRLKLTKTITFTSEYYYTPPSLQGVENTNSLAIGIDINTKGHIFQIQLTNSRGMTEKFFIGETVNKWSDGDIHLGFNITRDFKIRGRKYE